MPNVLEEGIPLLGIVAEFVTQHTECARRVVEPACHFVRRGPFNEEGAKGFILSVKWLFGREKKLHLIRKCYLITMIDDHACILLHHAHDVNI